MVDVCVCWARYITQRIFYNEFQDYKIGLANMKHYTRRATGVTKQVLVHLDFKDFAGKFITVESSVHFTRTSLTVAAVQVD